jgi:RNA polymerase sigma-70 factor (ECF subfamily)
METQREDDRHLVHQAKAGSFEAFEELVGRYERKVYGLALRMAGAREDAEEVVQETFLSALEHLASFREEAAFSTWLYRIATNKALKLIRKRKGQQAVSLDSDEDRYEDLSLPEYIAAWSDSPRRLAEQEETGRILEEALTELDDKYRLVFLLRDVQELSTVETAEALGITQANVKVRLLRARLMLRERLTRVFGDEATRVQRGHGNSSG